MKDVKYILNNWAIVSDGDVYTAPEHMRLYLTGDSTIETIPHLVTPNQRTSFIVAIEGEYIRTYSGSLYRLGTPAVEFERQYPNAKERLFETIEKSKK